MGAGFNGIIIFDDLESLNPGFEVTVYLRVKYLKNGVFSAQSY